MKKGQKLLIGLTALIVIALIVCTVIATQNKLRSTPVVVAVKPQAMELTSEGETQAVRYGTVVPSAALREAEDGTPFVYAVQEIIVKVLDADHRVYVIPVQILASDGDYTAIEVIATGSQQRIENVLVESTIEPMISGQDVRLRDVME